MMKLLFVYLLLLMQSAKPLKVTEKVGAVLINGPYALTKQDVTFRVNGKKYHVRIIASYRDNKLESFKTWKPEGYLDYDATDIKSDPKLVEYSDLNPTIAATILNDNRIDVNQKKYRLLFIDKIKKMVYYIDPKEKDYLYRLTYQ